MTDFWIATDSWTKYLNWGQSSGAPPIREKPSFLKKKEKKTYTVFELLNTQ